MADPRHPRDGWDRVDPAASRRLRVFLAGLGGGVLVLALSAVSVLAAGAAAAVVLLVVTVAR